MSERTTPIYRDEAVCDWSDLPTDPAAAGGKGIQVLKDGRGDVFRRRYRTRIKAARYSATELVASSGDGSKSPLPGAAVS